MAKQGTAFDLASWCLSRVRALQLQVRYQKAMLHGPWAFAGATAWHDLAAWQRALGLFVRIGARRRGARGPRPEPAQLRRLADLLGSPATLPDPSQRTAIASTLRDLHRHSDDTLFRRVFAPAERTALLELEFALHLAGQHPWYARERAPILSGPADRMPIYVFDARCLQNDDFRRRGVGLHARQVLAALRGMAQASARIVLLLDPALDPVDAEVAAECHGQVYSCAALDLAGVALFVSASPMTAGIGPVMPLLLAPHVRRVAIAYDFIPAEFPSSYLRTAADLISYQARIMALPAYHALLPISAATETALQTRFAFAGSALVARSGVADPLLHAGSTAPTDLPPRFILAPTGGDPRKNLLVVIAAEATNRSHGEQPNRIVVVGHVTDKQRAAARKLARRAGLPEVDIQFQSDVAAPVLAAIYRQAVLCVVPSFAEGFSIPLAEAVHRGTPVVASDIPVHRELLGSGPWLAAPSSVADLARAMRTTIASRQAVLRRQQDSLGDKAQPDAVRGRIAAVLAQLLRMPATGSAERHTAGDRRPRIAVATPWPPQKSGIAAYSRHTMECVADFADVTILTNAPVPPPAADDRLLMREISAAAYLDPQFDCVVTVLGNSPFHLPALEYAMDLGGPVLAHDNRMIDFYRHLFGNAKTARLLSTPEQPVEVRDIARFLLDLDRLPALGYRDVGRVATPLLLHSKSLQARLAQETEAQVVTLPFIPYRRPPEDAGDLAAWQSARRRRQLDDTILNIATFGMLDRRTKGGDLLVEAMAWLDLWRVPARLHVVGEVPSVDRAPLEEMVRTLGLQDRIVFYDYLDEAGYGDMLRAVDLAVQLRVGSVLTLSGALLDCIAFGLPAIATESMARDMDAPAFVATIPDKLSPLLVAEAIIARGRHRSAAPREIESQRLAYLADHSAERYARAMIAALRIDERTAP
jgi:glycosyltransferase involved in cell wall biosynthesis